MVKRKFQQYGRFYSENSLPPNSDPHIPSTVPVAVPRMSCFVQVPAEMCHALANTGACRNSLGMHTLFCPLLFFCLIAQNLC